MPLAIQYLVLLERNPPPSKADLRRFAPLLAIRINEQEAHDLDTDELVVDELQDILLERTAGKLKGRLVDCRRAR
ncbi:hypothetical protein SBOR_2570 [Sclerotinia borealis F-4128]|uniref:Uncharacterized protein n=1 Tax=Sclerotinia borealis (strain F-4128) TaxID=1432307 RepID=W9CRA5_SCLBF|nr:hypothetical protein SBOR_2570 [Sclerotinia borealis F-4128]